MVFNILIFDKVNDPWFKNYCSLYDLFRLNEGFTVIVNKNQIMFSAKKKCIPLSVLSMIVDH